MGLNEEPLTDDEVEELLKNDHGWQFEGPFYTEVPHPKPEYVESSEALQGHIKRLQDHLLTTVIIRDPFGKNHNARRDFLEELELESFVKRRNKLKGNNVFAVLRCMEMIRDAVQKRFPALHSALCTIFTPEIYGPMNTYNQMEFEEKVAYARRLDEAIYKFLEILFS